MSAPDRSSLFEGMTVVLEVGPGDRREPEMPARPEPPYREIVTVIREDRQRGRPYRQRSTRK